MLTKEEMMNSVVSNFGLENKWTVWFFECAERLTDEQLFNAYVLLEDTVYHAPEDDDDYFVENDFEQGFDPYEGCYTYDC